MLVRGRRAGFWPAGGSLFRPRTGYYETLIEEAAALWESLSQNHPFADGHKRTAFAVTYIFLMINRAVLQATEAETEACVLALYATDRFDFEHLNGWLRANVHLGDGET
jgi:death-on-curing protein